MPLGDLEDEAMAKVLIVAQDQILIENLRRELPVERQFKVGVAASGFEAGIQAESFQERLHQASIFPSAGLKPCRFARRSRKNADFGETILIALLPDDGRIAVVRPLGDQRNVQKAAGTRSFSPNACER